MIFIGVALYISKQLNTGIRWILPYQLFLLWLFFFFLPYFQIKETETFHAIEHKLHTALKQAEHFNIYLLTPAFYHLLPELCFFSYSSAVKCEIGYSHTCLQPDSSLIDVDQICELSNAHCYCITDINRSISKKQLKYIEKPTKKAMNIVRLV